MDSQRVVPVEVVEQLQFITGTGQTRVRFESTDRLDRQTVRRVRELTPESAHPLDGLLEPSTPQEPRASKQALGSEIKRGHSRGLSESLGESVEGLENSVRLLHQRPFRSIQRLRSLAFVFLRDFRI